MSNKTNTVYLNAGEVCYNVSLLMYMYMYVSCWCMYHVCVCSGIFLFIILSNEINSLGRTTIYWSPIWILIGWFMFPLKLPCECMENSNLKWRDIFWKLWCFIACDFMSIMKIDEEGHNTFTYACITLLPRVMRENSYIY